MFKTIIESLFQMIAPQEDGLDPPTPFRKKLIIVLAHILIIAFAIFMFKANGQ